MKLASYSFFLLLFIFSFSCKKEILKETAVPISKSIIKYAKGFDIVTKNGLKKLIIKTGYQNTTTVFEYLILNKTAKKATLNNQTIKVPIKEIVVTSTTHIPMVELLNEESSIVGFPHATYVSSEKTRALVFSEET